MIATMRRFVLTVIGVACLVTSTPAGAATLFGSNLANPANGNNSCGFGTFAAEKRLCIVTQASQSADIAPGGLRAPSDGVIVRWRMKSGTTNPDVTRIEVALRLFQVNTRGALSDLVQLPLGDPGIHSYDTRLPVKAGDRIGLDSYTTSTGTGGGDLPVIFQSPDSGTLDEFSETAGSGPPGNSHPEAELLLQAEVEPDADHDGYGDETQDRCPTNGSTQAPCSSTDHTAPVALMSVSGTQNFIKSKEIVVGVKSNEAGTATASGALNVQGTGKAFRLAAVTQVIAADRKATLHLAIGRRALRAAKRALRNGKKVKAVITVQAKDTAGNAGAAGQFTVKPKPLKRHH